MNMQVCFRYGGRIAAGILKTGLFFTIALPGVGFKSIGESTLEETELTGILAHKKDSDKQYGIKFPQVGFG